MTDVLTDSYIAAIKAMRDGSPRPLMRRVQVEAEDRDPSADVSWQRLIDHLQSNTPNDPLRKTLHLAIATWDAQAPHDGWAGATKPATSERREKIYAALQLDETINGLLDELMPVKSDGTVVISDEFLPWYPPESLTAHELYWPHYKGYLLDLRDWDPDAVVNLDSATGKVVERLGDPTRVEAYQSKGLVVGYVQSGKTANFTGVIAKAVDVGYRLIIVLTGTVDILRQQTQRRMDMELVGKENILRGIDEHDPTATFDYFDDPDWRSEKFVRHGFLPSQRGYPDIIRLTGHGSDYRSLRNGIIALEMEKRDKTRPLFDLENLFACGARLAVVKKNGPVLSKLVKDLQSVASKLGEIPALIIDDESDQASVNTTNPKKWREGQVERTRINKLLSELLGLLPRAQYVGYTATPYANVFIDPSDTENIFPKDFLITLDRPDGYMGVHNFHDIDNDMTPEQKTVNNSNERAYVRDLDADAPHGRQLKLQEAIDAFVLSGAIKLYREQVEGCPGFFRHHTMLVHESVSQVEHKELAEELRALWRNAGYVTPSGMARLQNLFVSDFLPVSRARAAGWAIPGSFSELRRFIGSVLQRATEITNNPVIIVNGDKDIAQEPIDFDKRKVWRILVGGTKLSRGFTIEGLSVSYYRRRAKQADSLMQMGRWFGFREGYEDLVRLYIGRRERDGARIVDLYKAFEAIVQDEELFRNELRRYSVLVDGRPQVTPRQVPPLVSQHLPWLRPAARNKMFNAQLVKRRSPGTPVEPTAYPKDETMRSQNYKVFAPIVALAQDRKTLQASSGSIFDAFLGTVTHEALVESLGMLQWLADDYLDPDLAYLRELSADRLRDWLLVLPQQKGGGNSGELPDIGERSLFYRVRRRDPSFGAISEPRHRDPILRVAQTIQPYGDPIVEQYVESTRGGMLIYPVIETPMVKRNDGRISLASTILAFQFVTPAASAKDNPQLVQFVTRNKRLEDMAIVSSSEAI